MNIQTILTQITSRHLTVATAESCTGGLIAHTLTNIPGSSVFFNGGVICYSNESKTYLLGVPSHLINRYGAVSKPVAKALAEGIRKQFKTNLGISTTGIAGPTGGSPQKPVGLVFIAVTSAKKTIVKRCFFTGTRLSIKTQACHTALGLLLQSMKKIL